MKMEHETGLFLITYLTFNFRIFYFQIYLNNCKTNLIERKQK